MLQIVMVQHDMGLDNAECNDLIYNEMGWDDILLGWMV